MFLDLSEQHKLILKNIRLPCFIAGKMFKHFIRIAGQIRIEDLVSVGVLGLAQAARKYDPQKGPFNFYASRTISNSILAHIYNANHPVIKGHTIAAKTKKILRKIHQDALRNQDDVTAILKELKLDSYTFSAIMNNLGLNDQTSALINIDLIDGDDCVAVNSKYKSESIVPFSKLHIKQKHDFANKILSEIKDLLTDVELDILLRRLGYDPYMKTYSLADIGVAHNMSLERVSYIYGRVIHKIRQHLPDNYWDIMYENFI